MVGRQYVSVCVKWYSFEYIVVQHFKLFDGHTIVYVSVVANTLMGFEF